MSTKSLPPAGDAPIQEREAFAHQEVETFLVDSEIEDQQGRERLVATLRLFWAERSFLFRAAAYGLVASIVIALLIPNRYTSETRLMPPDKESGSALAAAAAGIVVNGGGDAGGLQFVSDLVHAEREHVEDAAHQIDMAGLAAGGMGLAGARQRHGNDRENQQNAGQRNSAMPLRAG